MSSTANVSTDRPSRYGKQLVAHLTRRLEDSWDEGAGTGWLDAEGWSATLTSAEGSLDLEAVSTPDRAEQAEDVIGRHLVRFGARDELVVRWTRSDGTPGTVQENVEG